MVGDDDVSILVILDVALKHYDFRRGFLVNAVSILVILDVALKLLRASTSGRSSRHGFNPCYPGCCSQTRQHEGT